MAHKVSKFTIISILLIFISCSIPKTAKKNPKTENKNISGLLIDNRINRGTGYTDSLGSKYNLRYIPINITNDSTISIHIQIDFSKEYNYAGESFRVIPLPEAWALDGVGVTEGMIDEFPRYIEKPSLNKTIEPGKKLIIGIGALYSNPPKLTGVLPNFLFTDSNEEVFTECEWTMKREPLSNHQKALWLRLNLGKKCTVIPCGQITYSAH